MVTYITYPRRTEPDLRQELINTLDGKFPEIAKKQTAVLRRIRLPLEECSCVDKLTHEPDLDYFCPFCFGEGNLWNEVFIDVYKVLLKGELGNALKEVIISPGLSNEPVAVFYIRSSVTIGEKDKVVELELDEEGDPIRPYRRRKIYRIGEAIDLRSDNGRREYWQLTCYAEHRKFLNGPSDT